MADLQGVRLLFHHDWWDGPISGLAEWQGREHWYQATWDAEADDWAHPRTFVLRRLSDEEIAEEWRVHRAFEAYVGTIHCNHDGAAERVQRPQSEWPKFYEAFPVHAREHFEDRPEVGTFTI